MANLQQNQPTFAIAKAGLVEGGGSSKGKHGQLYAQKHCYVCINEYEKHSNCQYLAQ